MFNFKNIVIVLPERLGDAIFHTPSIELIKKNRPDVAIDIIALSPLSAMVVQNNPHVHKIHVTPDTAELKKIIPLYDAALNARNHPHIMKQLEAHNVPAIITVPSATAKHHSEHALHSVKDLLGAEILPGEDRYRLYPKKQNFEYVHKLLEKHGVTKSDILIGCHIGSHSFTKRKLSFWKPRVHPKVWAFENFAKLEAELRKINPRFRLVLTGSLAETVLGKKFQKRAPRVINLIDRTTVLDLAALMESLAVFISSDTGVMHVACSTNVGVIALFGPTSFEATGPYPMQPNYRILQSPIINQIRVEQVVHTIVNHPAVVKPLINQQHVQ